MKKIYLTILAMAIVPMLFAQYSEDFESYTDGDYIGVESDQWSTWSGTTGGSEDAQISTDQANSGINSIYFEGAGIGGPQDVVLLFDSVYTEDIFNFECAMYIPDGSGAYFNFQGTETIGETWALNLQANTDGTINIYNNTGTVVSSTFTGDEWFTVKFKLNLTLNLWAFFVDGVLQGTWVNDVNAVSMIDFYPTSSSDVFYIDDVAFSSEEFVLPDLDAWMQSISIGAIGLVGQEKTAQLTVKNAGVSEITSFDVAVNYDGTDYNWTESDLTLGSLESMNFFMSDIITLVVGANDMTATISNINGMGDDDDPIDDSTYETIDPASPAPGRVVIGEEGTGTWCGWCPRGTVAMDFMADEYDGYYMGIAVHNGDPMTDAAYDAGLGFTSFPDAKVDRIINIDPSLIEPIFADQIELAAAATIVAGAEWNGDILNVSLTYTFMDDISGNWKIACVLTEDGVSGTSSGYAQSNYYSGGSNGVMGGFENLGNPVPASQMVYDHVARVISPSTNGLAYAFPDGATTDDVVTFNFSFNTADWNTDNMHIIGMLIENNGDINNGGGATIDEAILNGYIDGEAVVGVKELSDIISKFELYPNPARNMVNMNIELENSDIVSLQIMDITGKQVRSIDYGQLNGVYILPIDLSDLDSGMYMLNLLIGNQMITRKLMVE